MSEWFWDWWVAHRFEFVVRGVFILVLIVILLAILCRRKR